MRRKRYQEGSLQVRSHGKRKMWVVLYRDAGIAEVLRRWPAFKDEQEPGAGEAGRVHEEVNPPAGSGS